MIKLLLKQIQIQNFPEQDLHFTHTAKEKWRTGRVAMVTPEMLKGLMSESFAVKSRIVFLPYCKNTISFLLYGKNTISDFTVQ